MAVGNTNLSCVWLIRGYDKNTGKKKEIEIHATTERHAITIAYGYLTYPESLGKQ